MAKIDCSVTVNYLQEHTRMCKYHITHAECHECPMGSSHNGTNYNCEHLLFECPQKAIEIVQKWSDEHPVKTRLDDLLEKYPKAWMEANSSVVAPWKLGYCRNCSKCSLNGRLLPDCWGEPVDGGATGEAVE